MSIPVQQSLCHYLSVFTALLHSVSLAVTIAEIQLYCSIRTLTLSVLNIQLLSFFVFRTFICALYESFVFKAKKLEEKIEWGLRKIQRKIPIIFSCTTRGIILQGLARTRVRWHFEQSPIKLIDAVSLMNYWPLGSENFRYNCHTRALYSLNSVIPNMDYIWFTKWPSISVKCPYKPL